MRAATIDRYGPPEVVQVREVPDPTPGTGDVLVRVTATPVTAGDARIRGARFPPGFAVPARLAFGVRRPRRPILGGSFAGVVEAVGAGVTDLAPGDRVAGLAGMRMGAHAERITLAASRVVPLPDAVDAVDAAAVLFGALTARFVLQVRTSVGEGTTVLVNGGSGAVGTNAVQLARHLGATVTAVTSGANAELVRDLGADAVVDHTRRDVTELDQRFDVVVDLVGNLSVSSGRRLLAPDGTLVLAVAGLVDTVVPRRHVVTGPAPDRAQDAAAVLALVESGALRAVVESRVDLDHIVDAHRRADSGHKVGNVVVEP